MRGWKLFISRTSVLLLLSLKRCRHSQWETETSPGGSSGYHGNWPKQGLLQLGSVPSGLWSSEGFSVWWGFYFPAFLKTDFLSEKTVLLHFHQKSEELERMRPTDGNHKTTLWISPTRSIQMKTCRQKSPHHHPCLQQTTELSSQESSWKASKWAWNSFHVPAEVQPFHSFPLFTGRNTLIFYMSQILFYP